MRKRKIVKSQRWPGVLDEGISTGDLDFRLDGPQTIEERRNMDAPLTGWIEKGRGDRGMD